MLRPLAWGLALLAVLVFVAARAVDSEAVRGAIIERATALLEERLGREVEIGHLDLDLVPLELEVRDARLAGATPAAPPVLEVERLRVLARLELGWPLGLGLRLVEIDRPVLRLEIGEDGKSNLPSWSRGEGAGGRRVEVEVDSVLVRDGVVDFEERRLPLSFASRDLSARVVAGEDAARAHLVTRDLEVVLPEARPYLGTLVARGTVAPGRVELLAARLGGPDLAAGVSGAFTWEGEERDLVLAVELEGDTALLERLGYTDGELLAGPFRWDGGFTWSPAGWSFRGDLASSRLVLDGRPLAEVEGMLAGDAGAIDLDLDRALYAGGELAGTVRVELGPEERPTEVDLAFERIDLPTLAADQGIELEGISGRLNGVFNYRFPASRPEQGTGWAEIGVTSGGVQGRRLGLTGTVPLVVQGGEVRTRAVRLTARGQRINANGRFEIASRRGVFDYRITSDRLELLTPILPLDPAEPQPWVPTAGHGIIAGTLYLAPERVSSTLTLDLYDIEAPGVRAERLTGALTVSQAGVEAMRIELSRPQRALMVTGSLPFEEPAEGAEAGGEDEGSAGPAPPFDLVVDAVSWPLADAAPWLPFELPLAGDLSGTLLLGGSLEAPEGELVAEVVPAEVLGITVARGTVRLTFDPERAVLEEVVVSEPAGELRLSGTVPFGAAELDLSLDSGGLDLGRPPFAELLPGGLSGVVEVGGEITGTLEAPELVVHLDGRDLALAGRPLGEAGRTAMVAFWDGANVEVDGSLIGLLDFVGGGRLDDRGAELEIVIESDDVGRMARLAVAEGTVPAGLEGTLAGTVLLRRDFDDPAGDLTRLALDELTLVYGDRRFENLEPVVLLLEEEAVVVESIFLAEPGGVDELFVAGRVGLSGDLPLDLRVQSRLSADWLEAVLPGAELEGELELLAAVRGTVAQPAVDGQAELRDGRAILEDFPQAVEGLTATVLFYPEQVVLDSARARIGGGTLRAGGSLDLYAGGPTAVEYRFQLSGSGLRLRYPEGWLIEGGTEVEIASTEDGRTVRGVVSLDRALYYQNIDVGLTTLLQGFFQRQRYEVESTDELLTTTQLNLSVEGPGALRVRNNLADFSGNLDLTVRGNLADPVLFGRVEVLEGGNLVYADTDYRVERLILTFANPYRLEPILDMVATTRVDQYQVTLNLSGTLDRLNATFASDPPLADLEILGLVATGRVSRGPGITGGTGDTEGALAAEGLLYGQAASLISKRVNTLFGLDRFRIDPLTGESGGPSTARVTVGKRLSRDLVATYSYDPSTTEQQILQLEWQVTPGFAVVVTQNGDGSYAVDGRWERRFR